MFRVEWMPDQPNILLQTVPPEWTTDEFITSVDEIVGIMQEQPDTTIDLICDMTNSQGVPSDVPSRAQHVSGMIQPNSGMIVLVGMNLFEKQLLYILRRLIPTLYWHIRLAESVTEAIELIHEERAKCV